MLEIIGFQYEECHRRVSAPGLDRPAAAGRGLSNILGGPPTNAGGPPNGVDNL